ncbi:MAG: hypothetical protein LWW80_01525 [Thiomonas sp.]|nr:hypothetical protein [Thiomonas sp.]
MIPEHAAAKLADLRQTADTLDYLAREGQVGEGEACVLAQMAKAIRADVEALELEIWRSEQPAEGMPSERPNLFH